MRVTAIDGNAAGQETGSAPSPRLVEAAHEFEAQMMKELLEPMTRSESIPGGDEDEESASGSAGALGTFASEALGQAISARGGFGVADKILKTLSQSGHAGETGKVTIHLHDDTVMRASK